MYCSTNCLNSFSRITPAPKARNWHPMQPVHAHPAPTTPSLSLQGGWWGNDQWTARCREAHAVEYPQGKHHPAQSKFLHFIFLLLTFFRYQQWQQPQWSPPLLWAPAHRVDGWGGGKGVGLCNLSHDYPMLNVTAEKMTRLEIEPSNKQHIQMNILGL